MRKYSIYTTAMLGMAMAITACSNEDLTPVDNGSNGKTYQVTLTAQRPSDKTRTVITEAEDGLSLISEWAGNESLVVLGPNGSLAGELAIDPNDAGSNVGVFTGTLTGLDESASYTVWYLGDTSDENKLPYAELKEVDGKYTVVNKLVGTKNFEISGAQADLCLADLLMKDGVKFTVAGEKAIATEDVELDAQNAMGHFKVIGYPEGIENEEKVTLIAKFNGQNGLVNSYKVTNITDEVYLPLLPGEYTPSFILNVGEDKSYAFAFGKLTTVKGGLYYAAVNEETEKGEGMEVGLKPLPELTGPVIEINGRKYRFVKGNLYCDILDKDNYVWHLYERETDYQLKAGTSSYYVYPSGGYSYVRQINGTWKGSSNPSNVNATNHIIDMFPWGATGLGTGEYRAKLPDIIRKGVANENTGTSYTGEDWPSWNPATMDVNANANILNLWQGYSFTDPVYDFGWAYMQNGRAAADTRTYVTAPLQAYAQICNKENSFSQGCVISKAGYDGSDAKGALILYGITDIADAKAAIEEVGGKVKTGFAALTPNKPKSGFTYLISLPNYESIQALTDLKEVNGKEVNIHAMFFASGGNGVYNFSSGIVNTNSTDGAYWTSNAAKGSSTTANAYGFYFRNNSSATEFCYEIDASGVSSKRNTQRSVRLMVDVTESEEGTVGPTM